MPIEMKVAGLVVGGMGNVPLLVLKDEAERYCVPIVIGLPEARAIIAELQQESFPRPMTHDLLKSTIEALGCRVERVVVTDLREDTFLATLHLRAGEETHLLDSRPSDAIALALRAKAPIFVEERVIEKLGAQEGPGLPVFTDDEKDKWAEILENLNPEDFGKYKM